MTTHLQNPKDAVAGPECDLCGASGDLGDLDVHTCVVCARFACDECIRYAPTGIAEDRRCVRCDPPRGS